MISQYIEGILCSPEHSNVPVRIAQVEKLGRRGCQGFVHPVTLELGSGAINVQVKEFFPDPVDDNGYQSHVDPNLEARENYEALYALQNKGFKVVPFFGLLRSSDGSVLAMSDLTDGETKEIIDEMWLHRRTPLELSVNGEVKTINADEAVKGLDNYNAVRCELLKTHMLQAAYEIHFGDFGMACPNMIIRDPLTNTGEVFVSDVGEICYGKSKYRDAVDFEQLLELPEAEIDQVFKAISSSVNLEADVIDVTGLPSAERSEYQDIFYKSAVGVACWGTLGGWYKDAEWSRKRFVRNQMSDHMMKTKLSLQGFIEAYKEYTGDNMFDSRLADNALSSYDLAFLAVLDLRMQYLGAIRDAIDIGAELPHLDDFNIEIGEDGLPVMGFFDNYNEEKMDLHESTIRYRLFPKGPNVEIDVDMDWHDAYKRERGSTHPFVLPTRIKSARIDGKQVVFEPSEIKVETILGSKRTPEIGDRLYYGLVVDGEYQIIYGYSIESSEEIDTIKPFLARNS